MPDDRLPGCPAEAIYDLVESLRSLVPGGQTVSAGSTLWLPTEEIDVTVARADALLYEAKATGRDQQIFRTWLDDGERTSYVAPGPGLRIVTGRGDVS